MRSARPRHIAVQRMGRRRVIVLHLGPRNTKLTVGIRACGVFVAIIVLAGIAGFLVNERIEKAEQDGGGLFAGLLKDL